MTVRKATCYVLALIACLQGCSTRQDQQVISVLQDEQINKHTVIGSINEPYFELLDVQRGMNVEFIKAPRSNYQRDVNSSRPNGGRVASCEGNQCAIFDSNKKTTTFLFESAHVVTPLYWSPDGRLLLFVRDLATVRFPVRCGFDEEHDVVVYEPTTQKELIVRTVCGGYPYKKFGWYTE
jgi:hypothetical protein